MQHPRLLAFAAIATVAAGVAGMQAGASAALGAAGLALGAAGFAAGMALAGRSGGRLRARIGEAEARLARSQRELEITRVKFLGAINTAPDGFAGFQPDGRLTIINERLRTILKEAGFAVADDLRREALLRFLLDRSSEAEAPDILQGPGEWQFEIEIMPGCWMRVSENRSRQLWSILRMADISDYRRALRALEASLERERETTAVYRNFVAMVSHQFRTPLAVIDSSAQRLIRRAGLYDADEVTRRANTIRKATHRLTQLVSNTLNAARLDEGQIEWNPRPGDLVTLVDDACARQRDLAPQRRITVEAGPEPLIFACDRVLFDEVVGNLLSNAVKYSGADSPIEVRCWSADGFAHCSITDRGIGIPEDELPRLFERFFRARTAAGVTGTGLGLTFARHLMELHGGRLAVASREGVGSTFTLSVPLIAGEARDAA